MWAVCARQDVLKENIPRVISNIPQKVLYQEFKNVFATFEAGGRAF
jgi:hypothetical protein